jgi:hypothetical protein
LLPLSQVKADYGVCTGEQSIALLLRLLPLKTRWFMDYVQLLLRYHVSRLSA